MARAAIFLVPLLLGGCVDAKKCMVPAAWKPCSGQSAEVGAGGSVPTIAQLSSPACNYVDEPTIAADIAVSDADGDATTIKITVSQGVRLDESEVLLASSGMMNGGGWSDHFEFNLSSNSGSGSMVQSTFQARVKVTDKQGNQSQPYCKDVTLIPE